ncbi:MAG: hypothetical protein IIT57_02735 [Treponema sp.]|nr:hypothetical protein [Treponema sp.]
MHKRRICLFLPLLALIFSASANEAKSQTDYLELKRIKNAESVITIVDEQKEISLVLNKEQRNALLEKLEVSKKLETKDFPSPCKAYKLNVYYDGKYVSFVTKGKTICQSGNSEIYELTSDPSGTIEAVFGIYDAFLAPLPLPYAKKNSATDFIITSYYLLQKRSKDSYYVLAVTYGSGLPVTSIRAFDASASKNFIQLDGDEKISVKNDEYELYIKGKKTGASIFTDYSLKRLKVDMHSFYMYHK